ncbi:MAG: hypothetical protein RIC56_15145 [Pseudomonadales bacterium]
MSLTLDKPWRSRREPPGDLDALPGHMGVFELGDAAGGVLFVGYAGGRSRFGLRGEIAAALERLPAATAFRYEVTTSYLTRYQELLMVHRAATGELPPDNAPMPGLGRLSPG